MTHPHSPLPNQQEKTLPCCGSSCAAFTLIEMLVVIAIMALLMSLLVPGLSSARGVAARMGCASNMKQIGTAFMAYTAEHEGRFPSSVASGSGSSYKVIGWDDQLAPYDGRGELSDEVKEIPFLNPNNYTGENARLYKCPASPYHDTQPGYRISYVAHATTPMDPNTGERRWGSYTRGIVTGGNKDDYANDQEVIRSLSSFEIPTPARSILLFEWHVYFHDMGSGPISWLQKVQAAHADSLNTGWFPTLEDQWVHGKLYKMNFLFADGSVRYMHMQDTVDPDKVWYSDPGEAGNGMWECQVLPSWFKN
jgi:prepilin-type N-terminal cleavage/methylation domain-containing protein/prepilin-type processing-associated H-X9-DG protein